MKHILSIAAGVTLLLSTFTSRARGQDGTPQLVNPTSSSYTCNPATCLPPNCMCASLTAPGGLKGNDVPQFVTVTFDDSIDEQLMATAYKLLQTKNPNGCPARGTWFVSIQYSNFSQVTEWYANGNEVADHTFTHVPLPSTDQIANAKKALNVYGGIPYAKIAGFRAPFLNYSSATLKDIAQQGFLYDSSATSVIDDAFFPYTLDNGLANDCWSGVCNSSTVIPGLWEIPMAAVVDPQNIPWLMDIYVSGSVTTLTDNAPIKTWLQTNFNRHYQGNRAPFGFYVHSTHLTNIPGLPDATSSLAMVQSFLSDIASQPNVWFVTNQQLLAWMKNPVPASQLGSQPYMRCQQPVLPHPICNGLGDESLTQTCSFNDSVWSTCYNCPSVEISLSNPVPPNAATSNRGNLPTNCDTVWWDPIASTCLCNSTDCQFKDTAVPTPSSTNGTNATSTNSTGTASGTHASSATQGMSGRSAVAMLVVVFVAVLLPTF